MSWSSEILFLVFWEDKFSLKCMLIDCHFYVEIYLARLHVQLFNFILYFVQFFVAYWSGFVWSHSSSSNENATPLQSIQPWKCNPIQQHIPISLLRGSNPPPPPPGHSGRFPFTKKNPEISVVAKVEFPIGKKLFHLVVNPGTWPGAQPWTWNWYKLQETSMEHDGRFPFTKKTRKFWW